MDLNVQTKKVAVELFGKTKIIEKLDEMTWFFLVESKTIISRTRNGVMLATASWSEAMARCTKVEGGMRSEPTPMDSIQRFLSFHSYF